MRISYYTEGPWVVVSEAEPDETDVLEVPDEVGKRWLAAQAAFDEIAVEARKAIDRSYKK